MFAEDRVSGALCYSGLEKPLMPRSSRTGFFVCVGRVDDGACAFVYVACAAKLNLHYINVYVNRDIASSAAVLTDIPLMLLDLCGLKPAVGRARINIAACLCAGGLLKCAPLQQVNAIFPGLWLFGLAGYPPVVA